VLEYLSRTASAKDDLVGAPSGIGTQGCLPLRVNSFSNYCCSPRSNSGYVYPSTWPADKLAQFAKLTGTYMAKTAKYSCAAYTSLNVIGDPCNAGRYIRICSTVGC